MNFPKTTRVIACESIQLIEANILHISSEKDFIWMLTDAAKAAKKDGFKESIVYMLKTQTGTMYYLISSNSVMIFTERKRID